MGLLIKGFITAGVLLIAYYAYNPLIPGVEEPLRFGFWLMEQRLVQDIADTAEFFGLSDSRIARRDLVNRLAGVQPLTLGENEDGLIITERTFDGVKVRIYDPPTKKDGTLRKGLFFVHGGGYILGNVDLYHAPLSKLALETGVVLVAVTYRLAPEHPSPAVLEDCYAASRYFFSHARSMGVDPKMIGVAGDSAGGNMAAVLSLKYRDLGGNHQFAYQVLVYPWVQAMDFRLPSYKQNEIYMHPGMRQKGMIIYTVSYIGIDPKHIPKFQKNQHVTKATRLRYSKFFKTASLPGYNEMESEDEPEVDEVLAKEVEPLVTNPYNFPLMAESLVGVAPALVVTVGGDTIRDDGLLYLERLRESGVKVEHYHDEICWHVAINFGAGSQTFPCGVRILDNVIKYIREQ